MHLCRRWHFIDWLLGRGDTLMAPHFADAVGYPLACAKGVKSMIVHSLSVKQVA